MDSMTLAVVGAAYGTSIAAGVSRRAWLRRSRPDALLVLLTACAMTAVLTIALQHDPAIDGFTPLLERIEYVATLLSGPALLFYVQALRKEWRFGWTSILQLAPAFAVVASASAGSIPIQYLLVHQMAYTALALTVRIRSSEDVTDRVSWLVLAFMVLVHLSQLVRMATRGSGTLRNVVPVTMSFAVLALGAWMVATWMSRQTSTASVAKRNQIGPSRPGTENPVQGSLILDRLGKLMTEERLYRRGDLGLHELAAALEVTPHQLSSALNSGAGVTLLDYLNRFRIGDAQHRLLDPGHDRYTIEAIGEMSGFGSRSSFHSAFRRLVGTSPARFRAQNRTSAPERRIN